MVYLERTVLHICSISKIPTKEDTMQYFWYDLRPLHSVLRRHVFGGTGFSCILLIPNRKKRFCQRYKLNWTTEGLGRKTMHGKESRGTLYNLIQGLTKRVKRKQIKNHIE